MTKGKCMLCGHNCGHIFVPHDQMSSLVHECITKLEDGCGHATIPSETCNSCKSLVVTVLWQLAQGATIG